MTREEYKALASRGEPYIPRKKKYEYKVRCRPRYLIRPTKAKGVFAIE
jgi:hypothetical protein